MKKEKYKYVIEIIILVLIDQILKFIILENKHFFPIQIINNLLKLTYVENFGIAFGLATGGRIFFIIINLILIGIIISYLFAKKSSLNKYKKISLTLISAGGIANLIDRIYRGYVIDYIDFSQIFDFPVFNFADIIIVVGTIFLAFFI